MKAVTTREVYLPELAGIGEKLAMVSLPAQANPASMVNTIHFYRRAEIGKMKEYFDLVWDRALPIKIGGDVFIKNLDEIERCLESGDE